MKTEKPEIPQGFTLPMAFMDMLPVLFFGVSVAALAGRFDNMVFLCGAVLVIAAGSMKVLWKFILAAGNKDIVFLNRQMRFLMPAGFILMTAALIIGRRDWSFYAVLNHIVSFPAILFFIIAACSIACMIYFAGHLNGKDAKSNWIEQGVNAFAQFFFMLGILL